MCWRREVLHAVKGYVLRSHWYSVLAKMGDCESDAAHFRQHQFIKSSIVGNRLCGCGCTAGSRLTLVAIMFDVSGCSMTAVRGKSGANVLSVARNEWTATRDVAVDESLGICDSANIREVVDDVSSVAVDIDSNGSSAAVISIVEVDCVRNDSY